MTRRRRRKVESEKATAPDANVLAMLERFPKQTTQQIAVHASVLVMVAALGLWGIVAAGWDVTALVVFFAVEFATIWLLNWLAIALLPTHLEAADRSVIHGWLWFGGVVLIGFVAYALSMGEAGLLALRERLFNSAHDAHAFLVARKMLIPVVALVLIHLAGLLTDIADWRGRGGAFRFWSATVFVMRLWFVIAAGIALLAIAATSGVDYRSRTAVVLAWALLLAADLFALWVPIAVRRKADRVR